jgi:hypothetical protein
LVKLPKFETLRWIAKIETLVFKLKNVNFGRVNYSFPYFFQSIIPISVSIPTISRVLAFGGELGGDGLGDNELADGRLIFELEN